MTPINATDRIVRELMQSGYGNSKTDGRSHSFKPRENGDAVSRRFAGSEKRSTRSSENGSVKPGEDYEARKQTTTIENVDATRLRYGQRRLVSGDRSEPGKDTVVNSIVVRIRSKVMALCPGTQVFIACALVAIVIFAT